MSKTVFVTVGTTKFDKLIETVTHSAVLKELNRRGYVGMTLQIGNTSLEVDTTPREGFTRIESFRLKASIGEDMQAADLIISHAGAGSCLEALAARKALIVVTNQLLMDNHQSELAEQLFNDRHLYYCTCQTLLNLLQTMDLSALEPLLADNSKLIAETIDRLVGFQNV